MLESELTQGGWALHNGQRVQTWRVILPMVYVTRGSHEYQVPIAALQPAPEVAPTTVAGMHRTKRASGRVGYDTGDRAATILRKAKDLEGMHKICEQYGLEGLRAKYGHLPPGLQRMAVGNALRKFLKCSS